MASFSRRTFLARSTVAAAAAGVVSAIPGLPAVLGAAQSEVPSLDGAAGAGAAGAGAAGAADSAGGLGVAADSGFPLVAHVRDLSTGEVGIFNGLREVVVRDPRLANSILRATR